MSDTAPSSDVIIGVDTHKPAQAAVAISALGARLDAMTIPAKDHGCQALLAWARSLGAVSRGEPRFWPRFWP